MSVFVNGSTVPIIARQLSDFVEGDIVLIPENGRNAEFYVACHDYESELNGTGRTLLVRKDCYDERVWHTSNATTYHSSAIDSWLNNEYKSTLPPELYRKMGATSFLCRINGANSTLETLARSVFLLSVAEYGITSTSETYNAGSVLPIAETLKVAYYNGTAVKHWTRTGNSSTAVNYILASGKRSSNSASATGFYSRPAFTLPSTAKFDEKTFEFVEVE